MADLVEKFDTFQKNLASEKRARPIRRQDKLDDFNSGWEIGVGSTEKYRDNWDRIFGAKGRDSLSIKGEECPSRGAADSVPHTAEEHSR